MRIEPGVTLLVSDDDTASPLLRSLHTGETSLLEAPPGSEWSDHQVVSAAVDAPHLVGREYWAMSSGERQRARLAVFLDLPGVLLLDEPFGYLDITGIRSVLDALRGRTAVLTSYDPRVPELVDRVVRVANGVAQDG